MKALANGTTKKVFRHGPRPRRSILAPQLEGLEERVLLATVTVNASQVVRAVDTQLLGVNVAW